MLYSILIIIVLIICFRLYQNKLRSLDEEQRGKLKKKCLFLGIAIAVAILAFAKGNLILGVIASVAAFLSRLIPYIIRFAPLAKIFMSKGAQANSGKENSSQSPTLQQMDKARAADILGVDINASKQEITDAHKKLMQKVHPDKGGSDALAIQINEAKKVLLKK